MSKPTPPDDLESRLRALAEDSIHDAKLRMLMTGNGVLNLTEVLRLAAAIGDEIGYARGVADAMTAIVDLRWPVEQREYEMARRSTLLTVLDAIRALAAQRTDKETEGRPTGEVGRWGDGR